MKYMITLPDPRSGLDKNANKIAKVKKQIIHFYLQNSLTIDRYHQIFVKSGIKSTSEYRLLSRYPMTNKKKW